MVCHHIKYIEGYVKNIGFTEEIMEHKKTEYYIHALAEVVGGENRNDCILVTR